MCKRVKYILYGLKKTCLGVLERGDRDKQNETGLKEGGGIEMSNYSAFHIRDARSPSLLYFTYQRLFLIHFDMHCHRCVLHLISMLHRRLQTF